MRAPPNATELARRRVFLVDDHPLVREWLATMIALERDLEVCGQAEEAEAALATVAQTKADVIIVDLSLPRGSGLELIKAVRLQHPAVRVLVLSMHDEANVAERAFRAGALGYVVKRDSSARIVEAVRTVLSGKFYASATLTSKLAGRMFGGSSADRSAPPEDLLSDREMEVFRLRGLGKSVKEIAAVMQVSGKTIGSYEGRIKEKLGFANAGDFTREAVLWLDRQQRL